MDPIQCCPVCGQSDTLILLGSRDDHPHRWRWWRTALTLLYLCERCDVLLEVGAAPEPRRSPRRMGSDLESPDHGEHPDADRGNRDGDGGVIDALKALHRQIQKKRMEQLPKKRRGQAGDNGGAAAAAGGK